MTKLKLNLRILFVLFLHLPIYQSNKVISHENVGDNSTLATVKREVSAEIVCFPLEPKPKAVLGKCQWIRDYFKLE